jgi:hypothetical protein
VLTLLDPPPPWSNQRMVVYHGTTQQHVDSIVNGGVDVRLCQPDADFGRGFYTTTDRRQADNWTRRQSERTGSPAAVVELELDRDELAGLEMLSFVRGDRHADDFWSLVVRCRTGSSGHTRRWDGYYDVVVGPVSAFWQDRVTMHDADQVSFHTLAAQRFLNGHATMRRRVW